MTDNRIRPRLEGSEADMLVEFLDYHRETLRQKTEGLDAAQLDTTLGPSTMTLGGLLKHLAFVEDWWFSQAFRGNPPGALWADVDWEADGDWDWHSAADDSPEQLRAWFDEAVAASDAIIREALPGGLDQLSVWSGQRGKQSLRWVLIHMVEEYARHCGHADLIRESIDGQVGV